MENTIGFRSFTVEDVLLLHGYRNGASIALKEKTTDDIFLTTTREPSEIESYCRAKIRAVPVELYARYTPTAQGVSLITNVETLRVLEAEAQTQETEQEPEIDDSNY